MCVLVFLQEPWLAVLVLNFPFISKSSLSIPPPRWHHKHLLLSCYTTPFILHNSCTWNSWIFKADDSRSWGNLEDQNVDSMWIYSTILLIAVMVIAKKEESLKVWRMARALFKQWLWRWKYLCVDSVLGTKTCHSMWQVAHLVSACMHRQPTSGCVIFMDLTMQWCMNEASDYVRGWCVNADIMYSCAGWAHLECHSQGQHQVHDNSVTSQQAETSLVRSFFSFHILLYHIWRRHLLLAVANP